MKKKTLLILGIAGLGLFFLNKGSGEQQEMQTIGGGGGGYSASMGLQEPAGLGSVPAQPTIVYATNLEAPNFPTGESASATTVTSKKTTTSGGGSGTPVYNPATKTYTFFAGTPENVKQQIISTTERQIASAPANNPVIVDYVKKQTVPTPTYNWAQRTAGQAYTGWTRLTGTIKGWF